MFVTRCRLSKTCISLIITEIEGHDKSWYIVMMKAVRRYRPLVCRIEVRNQKFSTIRFTKKRFLSIDRYERVRLKFWTNALILREKKYRKKYHSAIWFLLQRLKMVSESKLQILQFSKLTFKLLWHEPYGKRSMHKICGT